MNNVGEKHEKGIDEVTWHIKADVKKINKFKKSLFHIIAKILMEVADDKKDSLKEEVVSQLIIAAAAAEGITITSAEADKIAVIVVDTVDAILNVLAEQLEK